MVQPTTSHALGDQLIRTVKLIQAARTRGSTLVEGLDQSAYPILFTLGLEPRRMSDLADAIHSDISTVSRQVAGLRKAGYVSSTALYCSANDWPAGAVSAAELTAYVCRSTQKIMGSS